MLTPERGAQLHIIDPSPGLWTLVVDFFNTVSGTAVSQPFTVTLNDTPVRASAAGLPGSVHTRLTAGKPMTIRLRVTNDGSTPEEYFTDTRLSRQVTLALAPQTTSTVTLPDLNSTLPAYLVPTHTTSLTTQVSAKAPLVFDNEWALGDPDLISTTGKSAMLQFSAPELVQGDWTVTPVLRGPTGVKPAKPVTASLSMEVSSAAFDLAVSSPTGDLWLASTDPAAGFSPIVVAPGQTATIPVTITPEGAREPWSPAPCT